jgi:hypothetical protein
MYLSTDSRLSISEISSKASAASRSEQLGAVDRAGVKGHVRGIDVGESESESEGIEFMTVAGT